MILSSQITLPLPFTVSYCDRKGKKRKGRICRLEGEDWWGGVGGTAGEPDIRSSWFHLLLSARTIPPSIYIHLAPQGNDRPGRFYPQQGQ